MLKGHILRNETREAGPELDLISPEAESRIRRDMKIVPV